MRLDESNTPLPDTFLRAKVDLLAFEVINEDHVFPYRYSNPAYSYSVELKRPAVVMIIRLEYPRTYPVLGPIVWEIKGSSELVF
ncbi:hypothetical protein N6H14_16520 [Paenibacillus sp. CC-CFT747]|nr:hypothetical protein N6H14_16520 [Paenibacillus sp. CC-CFT747]